MDNDLIARFEKENNIRGSPKGEAADVENTVAREGVECHLKASNAVDGFVLDKQNTVPQVAVKMENTRQFAEPEDIVNGIISGKILDVIDGDKGVNKQLDKHAKSTVEHYIKTKETEQKTEETNTKDKQDEAAFERNSAACKLFAISEKSPLWQQKMMRGVYDFIFILWFIFCIPTIVPIMFISFRLKNIIKYAWLTVVIAILIYVGVIFTPILLKKFSII